MKYIKVLLVALLILMSGCAKEKDKVIINENGINTVVMGEKEMEWFRFGNEDGPKVVILPGVSLKSVMGSKDAIISAYSYLAEEYDVYLFERIRILPGKYDITDMAEDTLRAVKAIGLKEINVMGASMGGMIALQMAILDPETVKSIMLCSTAARVYDPTVLENWKTLAEERNLPELMQAFGEDVYSPSFFEQYKDIILASGDGATEQDYMNFIISLKGILSFDCYDRLKDIKCPALVIGASEDKILSKWGSIELATGLQCDSFIYEGYGHGVYDEAPDYLTHIKAFLDQLEK